MFKMVFEWLATTSIGCSVQLAGIKTTIYEGKNSWLAHKIMHLYEDTNNRSTISFSNLN